MKRLSAAASLLAVVLFCAGQQALAWDGIADDSVKAHDPRLVVERFAADPDIVHPVSIAFDSRGRLLVIESHTHFRPPNYQGPPHDRVRVLEDTDGDGKADKKTIFADRLHNPTGFELYNGGVIIAQAPDLMFLADTDGDDKADVRQRVLHGLDTADTHHIANSFALDPGGALYFQEGTFHHTQVETPYGPAVRNVNAGVRFRF